MSLRLLLLLAFSISLIILALVCISNPHYTMAFLAYLIGFVMVFSGIGEIIYFIQMRYMMILLDGILSCIFGLVLLFGGEEIAQNFVPLFIALWLIIKGVLWFIHSWKISQIINTNIRVGIIVVGGLYVLLGILFVLFPEILATLISLIIGIILMVSGIVGLYFWNILRKSI